MELICKPRKIELYINNNHKSISQIKAETGCDIIINGGLYDMSKFQPVCLLKSKGQILANDGYKYWGFGWNENSNKLELTSDLDKFDNYISCICIVKDHVSEPLYIDSSLSIARQRTAIGIFGDGSLWIFAQQTPNLSAKDLQNYANSIGVKDAIILDGGLSTQCIFPHGSLSTNRNVHNYICIWKEKEENMKDIEFIPITKSDGWKNPNFTPTGIVLHSTAMSGFDAYSIQKYFNASGRGASIHACVDDEHIVQCMPWQKKAGHVGGSFNNSHIGIEMCEPSGIKYNTNGSMITSYNPPKDYFTKVWNNAIDLCVFLCKAYNMNPLGKNVIVSHCESHALGCGSNHGDPEHWLKWENVTMDDFRQAVYNKIYNPTPIEQSNNSNSDVTFQELSYEKFKEYMDRYMEEAVVSEPSSWAKESCQKAIAKGIMKGDGTGAYNYQKPLTREGYLVLQDRAGLL